MIDLIILQKAAAVKSATRQRPKQKTLRYPVQSGDGEFFTDQLYSKEESQENSLYAVDETREQPCFPLSMCMDYCFWKKVLSAEAFALFSVQ